MRLARTLLAFNAAPPGSIIPLRQLTNVPQVPGHLHFARERLRVPPDVGLPHSDVPLAPLLSRLDATALLALYVAMLTERRIMFVSQSISTLTSCVHAAVALLSPFTWSNIFIPVLDSSLLAYCCAPNPYLIGTTPPQFVQLIEEYDGIGELVLVALDEGYVACLNGALPLVDLDAAGNGGGGSAGTGPGAPPGSVTYAGPKLSAERASQRASASGMDSPVMPSSASGFSSALGFGGGNGLAFGDGGEGGTSTPPAMDVSQMTVNRREGAALAAATQGAVLAGMAGVEMALSPFHSYTRSHAYDDEVVTARAYRRAYMARRAEGRRKAKERLLALFSGPPGGKEASRRASGAKGLASVFAPPSEGGRSAEPGDGTPSGASTPSLDSELDGFWAEESGTVVLNVDLQNMTSKGTDASTARRRLPAKGAPSSSGATSGGTSALARSLGISKLTGRLTALVTGGASTDCPGALLAHEVRECYAREKREGAFDETGLTAAFLAFVGVVFARLPEYVQQAPGGVVRFNKEDFTKSSAGSRFPTIARLLEEVQQTQLLQVFAHDVSILLTAAREASGGMPGNGYSHNGKLDCVELLFAESVTALASAGAFSANTASSGAGGGMSAAYASVQRRMASALAGLVEPLTDCPRVGDGPGVAGTYHTASTALAGVAYAGTCTSAVSYAPPPGALPQGLTPAPMPVVVTALRALLTAATSVSSLPEESPAQVARLACAASHDPHLLHVVLGVVWARMNECSDKNWPQGVRALQLLAALLRTGSPRVLSLSVGFIPLLRFLMHPIRAYAVRAGYFAEDLGGKADACGYVQGANVLSRSKTRGLFGAASALSPGVTLSTAPGANTLAGIPVKEGLLLVARAAARCYTMLASPRRWLLERAVAAGPAMIANGTPLGGPFLYPLVPLIAVSAPASASYPPGWLPSAQQPTAPAPSTDVPLPPGVPPPLPALTRQVKAGEAPWDVLHRVSAPAMASSRSHALAVMAAGQGTMLSKVIARPMHVHAAIAAMTAASAGFISGSGEGTDVDVHLSFLPEGRRPMTMAAACAVSRRHYGGLPLEGGQEADVASFGFGAAGRRPSGGKQASASDWGSNGKASSANLDSFSFAPAPAAAARPQGLPLAPKTEASQVAVSSRLSAPPLTASGSSSSSAARRPSGQGTPAEPKVIGVAEQGRSRAVQQQKPVEVDLFAAVAKPAVSSGADLADLFGTSTSQPQTAAMAPPPTASAALPRKPSFGAPAPAVASAPAAAVNPFELFDAPVVAQVVQPPAAAAPVSVAASSIAVSVAASVPPSATVAKGGFDFDSWAAPAPAAPPKAADPLAVAFSFDDFGSSSTSAGSGSAPAKATSADPFAF